MNRLAITLKAAKTTTAFLLTSGILISAPAYSAEVSQVPLQLGGGSVPGNLAVVPSVEWPTLVSVANLGSYSSSNIYVGYFDSNKCYTYNKTEEWFEPGTNNSATNRRCGGAFQWSGNFLNWAGTPTIDPFRSALTGGYRVRDENNLTVLSKSRNPGYDAGNRISDTQGRVPTGEIQGATPADSKWSNFNIRQQGLGTYIYFSNWSDKLWDDANSILEQTDYDPNVKAQFNNGRLVTNYGDRPNLKSVYRINMRVKVCVSDRLEANCKLYPNGNYKPEGLLQQYSGTLRYSAFGYLNDSTSTRDGGVLRANQKFIGDRKITPNVGEESNAAVREWDPQTGIQVRNPDGITSAMGVTIADSGVLNYINKFGQLNSNDYKSDDPVSELYYTAMRYFRGLSPVAAYSSNNGANTTTRARWADNFPVITTWEDPVQYACQKNVILGIGDVNTWRDKNLPGATSSYQEPSKPSEVNADTAIDTVRATQTIFNLEGITTSASAQEFTGRGNSAYIAGLAYLANTLDMRPSMAGKQTISTFWVDVRENQVLASKNNNQYWLATKYGGFKVPDDFGNPYERSSPLPEAWWRTTTDMLGTNYPRPDNFFVASDATLMVESLKIAFAKIAEEVNSTTTTLATNSTRLETDTAVFQSSLDSKLWSGDLLAKKVNTNGTIATNATWSAATALDSMNIGNRKIFTPTPLVNASTTGNGTISTSATPFTWDNGIGTALKNLLYTDSERTANYATNAQRRLDFLRGERSRERTTADQSKQFRQRASRLGDIINSDPQFVANQDYGYTRLTGSSWTTARNAYAQFRNDNANRTPMVVVGANDGMLHGFNASMAENGNGGQELFAFIPNGVFANLINLTSPTYSHRYYVDGTPRVSDAWLGNSWKTIVAGTTGAGGRSVFALDITDPTNMSASKFLWEFSHPDMGAPIGQPAIVALPNGKFSVVVTSGYRSTEQSTAKIWFLDAANGSVLRTITLNTTGDLGSPLLADLDGDQVADRLYVGDTKGNLWRINLSGNNASNWSTPSAPFFVATDGSTRQPITAPLASTFNEKGQHMVLFGTGSYMNVGDNEISDSPPMQSFYAIIDDGTTVTRSQLLAQEILSEVQANNFQGRALSNNNLTNQKGWYLDLAWKASRGGAGAKGERVISKATLRSDRVIFTSMTPSRDPCKAGGTSWVMALNLSSGSRLNYTYFDTNNDGSLSEADNITIGDEKIPVSGISDPDIGVIKGATPLYRWLCYAGSAGAAPQCIMVAGSQRYGRHAWQESR